MIFQFESPLSAFRGFTPPAYLEHYPATRTGMMLLDVPEEKTMEGLLLNISAFNAAWAIVLSVPYTSSAPPTYWADEVAFVQKHFSPAALPSGPSPPPTPAPPPGPTPPQKCGSVCCVTQCAGSFSPACAAACCKPYLREAGDCRSCLKSTAACP